MSAVYVVTGAMASGKSTVAQALSERFERSVHLRGDIFRKMIVHGAVEMGPDLDADARAQLSLRQDIAVAAIRLYAQAGFTVVYQDILVGDDLERVAASLAELAPRVVMLAPSPAILAERDAARHKQGYGPGFPLEVLANAIDATPDDLGLKLDTSHMSAQETVDAIMEHWDGH